MNYTAVIFNNTGFNNSNIPDSDTFVYNNMIPVLTTTPLNILQNIGLSNITIKAQYETIKNVDYCYIYKTDQRDREHTFFYFITTVNMVNSDTVVLTLSPDFLTSSGGPLNLEFLDGITERHHVSDDEFGKYTEDDVLLNCTEPLKLVVCKGLTQTNYDVKTFIESTIDLKKMGQNILEIQEGVTFTNQISGESCTVPKTPVLGPDTLVINNITETLPDGTIEVESAIGTKGIATFEATPDIIGGCGLARDLGVESAIINQYQIPNIYVDYSITSTSTTTETGEYNNYTIEVSGKVSDIELTDTKANNFVYDDTIKNKRCLYGVNNSYTLISSAGNKAQYKPEQLILGLNVEIYPRPHVITKPDCRSDGAPYFNFKYIDGSSLFVRNVVKGSPWRTIPLIFTQKSGNVLDQTSFDFGSVQNMLTYHSNIARLSNQLQDNQFSAGLSILNSAADVATSVASYDMGGTLKGASQLAQTGYNLYKYDRDYELNSKYLNNMYKSTEQERAYKFYSSLYTIAPDINFGYNNDWLRDFYGNSYMVYRYRPSDTDLHRQDILLTMYGYKHTDVIKPEYFTNRKYFNYISANNITIKTEIPNWMKTGISAQLSGGVRIWHVLPDTKYYEDNPVNETTTQERSKQL